mgnify:CR=1 FL=1
MLTCMKMNDLRSAFPRCLMRVGLCGFSEPTQHYTQHYISHIILEPSWPFDLMVRGQSRWLYVPRLWGPKSSRRRSQQLVGYENVCEIVVNRIPLTYSVNYYPSQPWRLLQTSSSPSPTPRLNFSGDEVMHENEDQEAERQRGNCCAYVKSTTLILLFVSSCCFKRKPRAVPSFVSSRNNNGFSSNDRQSFAPSPIVGADMSSSNF